MKLERYRCSLLSCSIFPWSPLLDGGRLLDLVFVVLAFALATGPSGGSVCMRQSVSNVSDSNERRTNIPVALPVVVPCPNRPRSRLPGL
eukprot:scaffold442_cov397-Prasinococcus_capsulatus_cf.AAC.5